jgi:phosphomannomutase
MDRKLPPQFERAFKDADIRGVNVTEIDDDLAYQVARAFVDEFGWKQVVVGYDMRISSPALVEAFMRGVEDAGADVLSIGLVTSPMLYYVSGSEQLPGVMVTASHSGPEYNGLKLVLPGAVPLTKPTGLGAIERRIKRGEFVEPARRGRRRAKSYHAAFAKYVFAGTKPATLKNISIAADVGNGMASVLMPLIERALPVRFETLFTDMDARFPNRGSDPTIVKHQKALKAAVVAGGHDFGIAFDGDADRIAFVDEQGEYVNCAIIGALIAEHLLKTNPGAGMVFTNLTSRVYEESIKAAGGKAIRARVGHAFLKRKLLETGALFGAEHSGHFFFKEFFNTDSTVFTLRYVLAVYAEAKRAGKTFSELVAPYRRYQQLEDVVIDVADKVASLKKVEAYIIREWPEAKIKYFDGIYVTLPDAWGVVKVSVTEHALKVMFEGRQRKAAKAVQDRLVAYIKTIAKE